MTVVGTLRYEAGSSFFGKNGCVGVGVGSYYDVIMTSTR